MLIESPFRPLRRLAGGRPRFAVALLALLALSACADDEVRRDASGDIVTYRCAEDVDFRVYFFAGNPTVRVQLGETSYDLPQVASDLGIVFSDDVLRLTILRDNASLTGTPRGDLTDCRDTGQELF
ncbi:MAG: hypothetical protein Kilf2KO_48460 [Rhodospirillales bacterium]